MKTYNMDKGEWRSGGFERGDNWRSDKIYQCCVCTTKTNKWIMGGHPNIGPRIRCPAENYLEHDEIINLIKESVHNCGDIEKAGKDILSSEKWFRERFRGYKMVNSLVGKAINEYNKSVEKEGSFSKLEEIFSMSVDLGKDLGDGLDDEFTLYGKMQRCLGSFEGKEIRIGLHKSLLCKTLSLCCSDVVGLDDDAEVKSLGNLQAILEAQALKYAIMPFNLKDKKSIFSKK